MAYTINKFNGTELIVLEDGTIDTSTSLNLVGRNYVGYGEAQNENFVFLLENFSNAAPPSRPLKGQTWFNSQNNLLHVYDGVKWAIVGAAVLSILPPDSPSVGVLWLRTTDNTLHTWTPTGWTFIGPEAAAGYGITRARTTTLLDTDGTTNPVILLTIDNTVIGICSARAFAIATSNSVPGFTDVESGVTLSNLRKFKGSLIGNATSATFLENPRTINGVSFNGGLNITIKSATTNKLIKGDYITGSDFDGANEITWGVDASSSNIIGKVVARNSSGGFAAGTITADLVGSVTGNVTAASGTSRFNIVEATEFRGPTLSGNAFTATQLLNARTINGVAFSGIANITVPASAQTLTGTFINPTVLESNLSTVGLLTNLNVADAGVTVGSQFKMLMDGAVPTIRVTATNKKINFDIADTSQPGAVTDLSFIPASESLALGGLNAPAFIPDTEGVTNLGHPAAEWNNIYANSLIGNADTATLATRATNVVGGGAGAIPYQTAVSTTGMLAVGTPGQILKAGAANTLVWSNPTFEGLTPGDYLALKNTSSGAPVATYDGSSSVPVTIYVDAVSTNTASKVVVRDASGNFAAGTITANLTGTATNSTNAANVAVTNDTSSTTAYVAFTTASSGNNAVKVNTGMSYNAATNVLNTTAVNAQFSTTRTAFDNSTRIATTAYVDNMLSKIPNKLVVSDPQPNLSSPSAQYADLINAYLPANSVTVGATFDFIINVIYAATNTSVSGAQWINAYQWATLSVGASTTIYDSATGFKLIYSSNGTTWNYTGSWSYV
jgi:hypothetical protein